jgi:hypothetical protein
LTATARNAVVARSLFIVEFPVAFREGTYPSRRIVSVPCGVHWCEIDAQFVGNTFETIWLFGSTGPVRQA